ncbi:MAG: hypothetical protein Q7S58_02650 [Candidatus Binatus sp.]|uniref:hypothetical protein n=1 Tax=Candidatus Binatus sp. TaxID=2811406 RepID=UPI00271C9551|nr:hypothetical protein [Candidatus Binatus sp.]MDO8431292.1 hypothetical protein [Candidatus Binatus sp.]
MVETEVNGHTSDNGPRVEGEADVIEMLGTYEDQQVTGELYDFGSQLVRDALDRVNWLDTKAGIFAGFSGAMIVVVVSTFASWRDLVKDWPIAPIFLFLGIVLLLLAAGSALWGLRVRTFEGFHEKKLWFASEYFQHPDQLRRYYLIGMYRTVVSHNRINEQKATALRVTERLVIAGAFFLALPLLLETWQLGVGKELASLLNYPRGWRL